MPFLAGQTLTAAALNSLTGFARYSNNGVGLPTIATGGDSLIPFNNPVTSSSYVTASGVNNTTFTINASGPCTLSVGARWKTDAAISAGPDWYFRAILVASGLEIVGHTEKAAMAFSSGVFFVQSIGTTKFLTAGDQIQFKIANGTSATSTMVAAGETIFCSFKQGS